MIGKFRRGLRELFILALLVGLVVWGMDQFRKPTLPAEFTDTALQTIAGDRIDLAVLSQQRPLLIYVWATWCGICRYTTPAMEKLAKEGGNVVSVALRSGDDEKLARWMHKKQLTMPVVNDNSGAISQRWQVSVTPTLVVVSKGEVVSTTTGWTSYWGIKWRIWWAGVWR